MAELARRRRVAGDVADPRHRARARRRRAGGRIDLLVNNASVLGPSPQPRARRLPARRARARLRGQRARAARAGPARAPAPAPRRADRQRHLRRRRRGLRGLGRLRLVEGRARPAHRRARRRAARACASTPSTPATCARSMHQEAFPGEDISDRPPPEESVPGLLALIEGELPSGATARASSSERPRERRSPSSCPPRLEAHEPPEARGLARDDVRLLVADAARPRRRPRAASATCRDFLRRATCWSSTPRRRSRRRSPRDARRRQRARAAPLDARARPRRRPLGRRAAPTATRRSAARARGERARLPAGAPRDARSRPTPARRLWLARARRCREPLHAYLAAHGRPIRYGYVPRALAARRLPDVFATEPGSAEMPSAGRPFTAELITRARRAAASSSRRSCCTPASPRRSATSAPYPERFRCPRTTARLVNAAAAGAGA